MKELVLCGLLFWLVASSVAAQGFGSLDFDNTPCYEDSVAKNITVGTWTITALYPDDAEFVLRFRDLKLNIFLMDNDGCVTQDMEYDALLSQITTNVYRAEVSPGSWIEINTATGMTIAHHNCQTTVYFPKTSQKSK